MTGRVYPSHGEEVTSHDRRVGRLTAYGLVVVTVLLFPAPAYAFAGSVLLGNTWLITAAALVLATLLVIGLATERWGDEPTD